MQKINGKIKKIKNYNSYERKIYEEKLSIKSYRYCMELNIIPIKTTGGLMILYI